VLAEGKGKELGVVGDFFVVGRWGDRKFGCEERAVGTPIAAQEEGGGGGAVEV